jgi:hypothetical protein
MLAYQSAEKCPTTEHAVGHDLALRGAKRRVGARDHLARLRRGGGRANAALARCAAACLYFGAYGIGSALLLVVLLARGIGRQWMAS